MKSLAITILICLTAGIALADIQAPPASEYGPTRKLGRGINNVLFAPTEILDSIFAVNYSEGNEAAFSYGLVRGVGRTLERVKYGVFEMATFYCANNKGSYRPFLKSDIPWLSGGYSEFAPELGWDTRYNYSRESQRTPW